MREELLPSCIHYCLGGNIEMFVEFLRRAAGAKARHTDESASGAFLSSMALAAIRLSLRFYEPAA
jgi:hypothetical protein